MTVSFVWVWFLLPETKGLRLEDMDVIFGLPESTILTEESSGEWDIISDDKTKETLVEPTSV